MVCYYVIVGHSALPICRGEALWREGRRGLSSGSSPAPKLRVRMSHSDPHVEAPAEKSLQCVIQLKHTALHTQDPYQCPFVEAYMCEAILKIPLW